MITRADLLLRSLVLYGLTAWGDQSTAWAMESPDLQNELRTAIDSGDEERAVLAIDLGAEPIRHLFAQAVENGWISMAEALLDKGQWEGGKGALDPLVQAVHLGDLPMVWVLLERGAPLNLDRKGETPLETAIREGQTEIALLLIDKGAGFRRGAHHALRLAARHGQAAAAGQLAIVRRLLEKGADRNVVNVRRDTAYSLAKLSADNHPDNQALKQIVELLKP